MGTGALCPGADVDVLSNAREDLPRMAQRVKELELENRFLKERLDAISAESIRPPATGTAANFFKEGDDAE